MNSEDLLHVWISDEESFVAQSSTKVDGKNIALIKECTSTMSALNRFRTDYCKRGSTRCKSCKKHITKGELRIGKSVLFKTKHIFQFYHVNCAFSSFKKARCTSNVISSIDEIDGIDTIEACDQNVLKEMVDLWNDRREKPLCQPKSRIKQPTPQQETPRIKRTYSLPCSLPKMGIMFTNADQLTTSN